MIVHERLCPRLPWPVHVGTVLLGMLIWNAGTTWWIWNSTAAGAIGAIIANSFLMGLPLWGFHIFRKKYGDKAGLLSFITFWLSFEYIHLNWQLSWPWLTLGNVFAKKTCWIQWYEITGTCGGSLWVLRPFLPQLQTTFVKALQNTAATVRSCGFRALQILVPLSPRVDPLCSELVLGCTSAEQPSAVPAQKPIVSSRPAV